MRLNWLIVAYFEFLDVFIQVASLLWGVGDLSQLGLGVGKADVDL